MGCFSTIDFAPAAGAHLSFYWTMNEGGNADRVDSTSSVHWPVVFAASAVPGLFSNGVDCPGPVVINQNPGMVTRNNTFITVTQSVSKGISVWWWMKKVLAHASIKFTFDTEDINHTSEIRLTGGPLDGTPGSGFEIDHTGDLTDVFIDTPDLNWNIGDWHMVAGTYDKVAQTLNCYIDGVLSVTIADPFTYVDITSSLMFLVNPSPGFECVVDELGLCLNGALTQSQITALWNGGAGVTYPGVLAIVPFP